jgi:hypothetical protein
VLCGCVNQLAQRQALLDRFVGHPVSELVQQLGVPARTYETDGVKYVTVRPATPSIVGRFAVRLRRPHADRAWCGRWRDSKAAIHGLV